MSKYEIIKVDETEIAIDLSLFAKTGDFWLNATAAASKFNVRPHEWLRLPSTERYITALIKKYPDLDSKCGKIPYLKSAKGRYGGTYLHRKLILPFLQWLSPEFAVDCNDLIEQIIIQQEYFKKTRLDSKKEYRPMMDAIQKAHDPAKEYHFTNENNMLCRIIKGKSAADLREEYNCENATETFDAREIYALAELRRGNAYLISKGTSYIDRKTELEQYYKNKLSQEAIDNSLPDNEDVKLIEE